ncbi:MAG: caspase family protein [Comamonadaceae bacterium]|nr:caspase family protein [Comamonadaceae bacterium]
MPRLTNAAKAGCQWLAFLLLVMAAHLIVPAPLAQAQAVPGQRLALVIGNAAYKSGPLVNPVNDARAMRNRLQSLGFEVLFHENLKKDEIGSIYSQFRSKIAPGGVALVFYAGHGVQFKGENYFPAVDANIRFEEDVQLQSLNLGHLLSNMEEAKAAVSLVFLDACRDNPFARSFRSGSRGLAKVQAASGTLIHYATKPGSVAADGDGQNGTYTEALLAQISSPGVPVEQMLKRVTNRVVEKTQGKQEPWVEGSLRGDFYFIFQGPATVQVQNAPADPEAETWRAADSVGTAAAYQSYLKRYPQGRYADAATIKLEALQKPGTAQSTSPTQPGAAQPGAPTTASAPIVAPTTDDPEAALWNEVKASGAREYLEVYLKQYPKGKYQALAKLELKKLDDAERAKRAQEEAQRKQAAEQARLEQLAAAQAARVQQQQAEQQAWDTAKAHDTQDAYAAYLQAHPSGRYAALAQAAQQKVWRKAAEREKLQAAERQKEALAAEQRAQQQAAQREREAQALKAQKASQATAVNAMPASARYSTVGSYPITDCVKDKTTGLTWEGKPASGERAGDKRYTNYGDRRSGDASAYADSVNAMRLCGYGDWRLPTKDELLGLVVEGVRPTFDRTWFPNTQYSWYWSSSSRGAVVAWVVSFFNGNTDHLNLRNNGSHVRLVR